MIRTPIVALAAVALVALSGGPATAASAQQPGCDVESATLQWGFKESFRAYIDGSVANGQWEVSNGATYDTPSFWFTSDDGRVDPRAPNGSVPFPGTVRFTGHDGVLDTKVENPRLVFRGAELPALLLLDVSGPTMDGDPVNIDEVGFVEVDLDGQDLEPSSGVVRIEEAPTVLTEDGHEAFPNYEAGEAFDPISATIDLGDCDLTGQPIGTDTYVANTGPTPDVLTVLGLATIGAVILAYFRLKRNRERAAGGDAGPPAAPPRVEP